MQVDSAEAGDSGVYVTLHAGLLGDVRLHRYRLARDPDRRFPGPVAVQVHRYHVCSLGGQAPCAGPAEAAAGPGNHGDLPGEPPGPAAGGAALAGPGPALAAVTSAGR